MISRGVRKTNRGTHDEVKEGRGRRLISLYEMELCLNLLRRFNVGSRQRCSSSEISSEDQVGLTRLEFWI